MSPHLSQLNVAMAHKNCFRRNNLQSSNWQHIQRLKITILGANWQLSRLERIAKCSYFILSTQNIKFYWFEMKIKTFLLPIWWYNRASFPLGNKYFGVFVLNGLKPYSPFRLDTFHRVHLGTPVEILRSEILLRWTPDETPTNIWAKVTHLTPTC